MKKIERPHYTHIRHNLLFEEKDHTDITSDTTNVGRFYHTPDGKKYPSVTTVLGAKPNPGITAWRQRVGEKEANRIMHHAATRGTALHETVERYCNNEKTHFEPDAMPNVKAMFHAIEPVLQKIGPIALQEKGLYSHRLELAGRVDMVADFDGIPSIIDFKTSSRRKTRSQIKSYFMQATAYATMFEEMTSSPIEQMVIIMAVENDPTPLVFVEKDREEWMDLLLEALAYYKEHGHPAQKRLFKETVTNMKIKQLHTKCTFMKKTVYKPSE